MSKFTYRRVEQERCVNMIGQSLLLSLYHSLRKGASDPYCQIQRPLSPFRLLLMDYNSSSYVYERI